jgi:hypothetical protein
VHASGLRQKRGLLTPSCLGRAGLRRFLCSS